MKNQPVASYCDDGTFDCYPPYEGKANVPGDLFAALALAGYQLQYPPDGETWNTDASLTSLDSPVINRFN